MWPPLGRPRSRTGALPALVLLAVLAACGGDDGPEPTASGDDDLVVLDSPGAGDAAGDGPASLEDVAVTLTEVARLDAPIAMDVRPGVDDVLYVAERAGRIRVVTDGEVADEPLLDIGEETRPEYEQGLLGLAFSPDGDHLYVSYTDPEGDSHLDEYALGPGATDLDVASRRNVIEVDQPEVNHNGGHVAFGPDGLLWWGLGDGGGFGDTHGNGQDTDTLLGSLVRIDPRPDGDAPYGIPDDNPFVDGGGRPEIVAFGLRNPWRFAFDAATGDLWIADVGQEEVEEVNVVTLDEARGANFGWNLMEGTRAYAEGGEPEDHVPPAFTYGNDGDRCSVTGGHVYRGEAIPALVGAYVWGDYCEGRIRALTIGDDGAVADERPLGPAVAPGTLVSFGEDAERELYVLSFEGTLSRLDPA